MPSILVKDSLRLSVEAASGGKVTVLYDDKGNPSYMRRFSPMLIKDLYRQYYTDDTAWNASAFKAIENQVHPAFLKGGTQIRELLVGQFEACEINGRACSLPGMDPRNWINYDSSLALCKNKGAGWTMSTMYIWGFLQALCLRQKYQPRGNTQYGRSHEVPWETAIRYDGGVPPTTTGTPRTKTGTGPASWSHDGTESGVYDLVGNVWEWQTLMKLVDGKVMMPADNAIDLAESAWPDTGARYDSTVGTADGTGNGTGSGDIGDPVISDTITKYTGIPGSDTYDREAIIGGEAGFRSMTKKAGYNVPVSLVLAGLAPVTHLNGTYETDNALKGAIWTRNYGVRLPLCGADWYYNTGCGLGALALGNLRSAMGTNVGFRPAFLLA